MTREEHLKFCRICNHHTYISEKGIICKLTNEIADFDPTCDSIAINEQLEQQLAVNKTKNELNLNTASQGIRLANYLLDSIFLLIITFIFGMVIAVILSIVSPDFLVSFENMGVFMEYFLGFISGMFYFTLFEAASGKTLAKFITKTKVVDEKGNHPDFETILVRSLCRFIPFDVLSFLGGEPTIGWHDSLSKTRVIEIKKDNK